MSDKKYMRILQSLAWKIVENVFFITSQSSFPATNAQKKIGFEKYLWQNFGIFPSIQKKSRVFDENGAKNKCLLLNIFFFLISSHCLTYSALLI